MLKNRIKKVIKIAQPSLVANGSWRPAANCCVILCPYYEFLPYEAADPADSQAILSQLQ
jgi:hypothetical protein